MFVSAAMLKHDFGVHGHCEKAKTMKWQDFPDYSKKLIMIPFV